MQRINLETAKLAKEAGYRIYSSASYWFGKGGNTDEEGRTNETPSYDFPVDEEKYLKYERYFAPYQTELQEWLREKHNIHIWCKWEEKRYSAWSKGFDIGDWTHDTYEGALEEGLQKALKTIINEKQ